ncbi:CD63 antigen-like isoform X2 [Achroia grisella]|uniref:CD63 antigen-like isoform X2 n=1 Tax=Achroia grisella TaxID=688607 RepID=UPI0027D2C60B|nr:CD63 antigen-like isoform X2 [Achroia grisella]
MGCGTSFVKYVLFFFNLVVALLGLAIIGVGVAFLLNWSAVKDELKGHLTVAPWVFIIIGAVMFVIAFFGCCGAIRESHCMVVTYAIFLLVIIILQVVLAILLFTYGNTIKDGLVLSVQKLWEKRAHDPASDEVFKNIEEQLQCCGKDGSGDYHSVSLPPSCCKKDTFISNTLGCTVTNAEVGCTSKVAELYEKWNKPIAGFAIGVACVEVVGALFALCLANSIRNMDRRYA